MSKINQVRKSVDAKLGKLEARADAFEEELRGGFAQVAKAFKYLFA